MCATDIFRYGCCCINSSKAVISWRRERSTRLSSSLLMRFCTCPWKALCLGGYSVCQSLLAEHYRQTSVYAKPLWRPVWPANPGKQAQKSRPQAAFRPATWSVADAACYCLGSFKHFFVQLEQRLSTTANGSGQADITRQQTLHKEAGGAHFGFVEIFFAGFRQRDGSHFRPHVSQSGQTEYMQVFNRRRTEFIRVVFGLIHYPLGQIVQVFQRGFQRLNEFRHGVIARLSGDEGIDVGFKQLVERTIVTGNLTADQVECLNTVGAFVDL